MSKRIILIFVGWVQVIAGGAVFLLTGSTPARTYRWFVQLFCLTGGRSNDLMSGLVTCFNPPRKLPAAAQLVPAPSKEQFESAVGDLRSRGYYVFPQRLSADICERVMQFALAEPSSICADDGAAEPAAQRRAYREDRGRPRGVRYDFSMQQLLDNGDVQCLLCDATLLSLAQAYLGSVPRADVLGLWWSAAYADQPSRNAAQLFHFDLDRIKWLKVFIYITDVRSENGPHSFVAGSHRSGGMPAALLDRGYVRLTDEDVLRHYRPEDIIEFAGPQGTIIVEDTRGLHKGKLVGAGDRLVLQLQFSNSLFGGTYPKSRLPSPERLAPELREVLAAERNIFRNFL